MTIKQVSDREIALQAQLAAITADLDECRKSNSITSKAFDLLERERDEYAKAADKMARGYKLERDTLRQQLAEALIAYRHKDGTTRFEQYAKDPVPAWAVDVQPVREPSCDTCKHCTISSQDSFEETCFICSHYYDSKYEVKT